MASTDSIPASDDPEFNSRSGSSNFFDTAKRAYASGMGEAQVRLKQAGGVVRDRAAQATTSSKVFMSTVATRVDEYAGKAHKKAVDYHGNISRALATPSEDAEGDSVKFPLSILTWCSSFCGSKKSRARELPSESEDLIEGESAENPDPDAAPHHDNATHYGRATP